MEGLRNRKHLQRPAAVSLERPLLDEEFCTDDTPFIPSAATPENNPWGKIAATWMQLSDIALSARCAVLDALPNQFCRRIAPIVPKLYQQVLNQIKLDLVVPFDKGNLSHFRLVQRLWVACHGQSFSDGEKSSLQLQAEAFDLPEGGCTPRWKSFGFQGDDPSTDFRGGGLCSLSHLVYLAEHYPQNFAFYITGNEYPFAVAGINMTMHLLHLLGLSQSNSCLSSTVNYSTYSSLVAQHNLSTIIAGSPLNQETSFFLTDPNANEIFHEIYCFCVEVMHKAWARSQKNIMEFNNILAETRKILERIFRSTRLFSQLRSSYH